MSLRSRLEHALQDERRDSWLLLLFLLAGLLLIAARLPVNHDVAWLLHVGAIAARGDAPYHAVLEIDPPPIIAGETMVAAAARTLHVSPFLLHRAIVLVICCGSLVSCLRLLAPRLRGPSLAVGGSVIAGVLLALPGYDIGQREHVALALMLPYVVAMGMGEPGVTRSVSAAIGVALKPHLLLVLLGVEVARSGWDARRLAIVSGVLTVIAVACMAWAPAYIPFALHWAPAYEGFAHVLWWRPMANLGGAGLALALFLLLSRRRPPVVRALAWAALGGCAAAALQAKAFGYHWLPAAGFLLAAAGLGLALDGTRIGWPLALSAPLMVLLVASAQYLAAQGATESPIELRAELHAALAPYGPGRSILGLTWGLQTGFPLAQQLGLRWIEPIPSLWPLDGALAAGRPDLAGEAVALVSAATKRDPPDLVLVDLGTGFSAGALALPTLAADPWLPELLKGYKRARRVGAFLILVRPGLLPDSSVHKGASAMASRRSTPRTPVRP